MVSRRQLITVGAAAGAASLLLPAFEKAEGQEVRAERQEADLQQKSVSEYVSITAPADPDFINQLNDHFPGLATDEIFKKILSHTVLVTNVGGKDINAFSTHWAVTTPTGGYEMALRHFFHPSERRHRTVHFGVTGNKTRYTGQMAAIKAGATRLVSPYFNWSSSFYQKNVQPDWKRKLTAGAHRKFTLYEFANATSIRATIDAVIVDQNQVIGPDHAYVAKVYRLCRNAEHDAAVGALNVIHGGASADQVMAYLETVGAKYPASPEDVYKNRIYRQVRQRQATVLARRLRHATPDQFFRTLQYLALKTKTTIQPA